MQGGVLSKVPNCYFFFALMVLLFCGMLVKNADKKVKNILQGNFSHGLVSSFETQCNARVFRCLLTKVLMCKVSKSNFVNITDAMNKVHVQNNFTLYAQYAERTLDRIENIFKGTFAERKSIQLCPLEMAPLLSKHY